MVRAVEPAVARNPDVELPGVVRVLLRDAGHIFRVQFQQGRTFATENPERR